MAVVFHLLAESVCQAREAAHRHAHGEILAFDVRRTYMLRIGVTAYGFHVTTDARCAGAPPYSPVFGERVGSDGEQKRLVEEYPQFEAEYGLPAGLDVSQPAHVLFPPPEQVWQVVPAPPMAARPHRKKWTKEAIELEALHKHREQMGPYAFNEQFHQIQERISTKADAEYRKRQEAAWRAEADRRNAAEEAKDQEYANMDEPQRRAFHLGIVRGLEAAEEQAEEEARKKPAAKVAVGS